MNRKHTRFQVDRYPPCRININGIPMLKKSSLTLQVPKMEDIIERDKHES